MPAPSAELVLWRVTVEAYLSCAGKKRGERFLKLMADKLASEESLSQVFHIRPTEDTLLVQRARRQAVAMFDRFLPVFLARLPGD